MDTILHLALGNAVLAGLLALLVAAFTRWYRHPALAHRLWLLVLLKLVTPPFLPVSIPWPVESASVVEPSPQLASGGRQPPDDSTMSSITIHHQGASVPRSPSTEAVPYSLPVTITWQSVVAVLWLSGSVLWFLVAGKRIVQFRRLLRFADPAPAAVQEQAQRLAQRLGLRVCPQVWLIPAVVSPMVLALFRAPRLLLPAELWERLTAEQRETVLVHELAHLRRGDHWVRRLELVTLGLYWWHPAAWWARREIQEAEEACCDAWVNEVLPESASAYAEALVQTVAFLSTSRAVLPSGASGIGRTDRLKRRLTMIVRGNYPKGLSWAGTFAVLGLGAFVLSLLPTWAEQPGRGPVTKSANRPPTPDSEKADQKPADDGAAARDEVDLLEAQLAARRAELKETEVRIRQAQRELKRLVEPRQSGTFAFDALERANTELADLKARREKLSAQVQEVEGRLDQARSRLPERHATESEDAITDRTSRVYQSQNFVVEVAQREHNVRLRDVAVFVAQAAERYRKNLALDWLGKELPAWKERCHIKVTVTRGDASGGTVLSFLDRQVVRQRIEAEGRLDVVLSEVLPKEIAHTIFAHHLGQVVPSWADLGAQILSLGEAVQDRDYPRYRKLLGEKRERSLRELLALRDSVGNDPTLYTAEAYCLTRFLVRLYADLGKPSQGRQEFLSFVARGMKDSWDEAVQAHYDFRSVEELEAAWLGWLKLSGPMQQTAGFRPKNSDPNPPAPSEPVLYQGKDAGFWLKQLKDTDPEFRKQALTALGGIGQLDPKVIPAIVHSLKDRDVRVREDAARILYTLGHAAREAVPALVALLNQEKYPSVRRNALSALAAVDVDQTAAVPTLIEALKTIDLSPRVHEFADNDRMVVARALGSLGPKAKAAVPALRELLKSENRRLREAVEEALKKIEPTKPAARLPLPPDVQIFDKRSFKVPFHVDAANARTLKEVLLVVSTDQGSTWNESASVRFPTNERGFTFDAPADGEYWFALVLVDKEEKREPSDLSKIKPSLKVLIETKE